MTGGTGGDRRRVTLRSVAQRAGVSVSTASLVFSGKGAVADDTRRRVLEAAADLHYRGPDPLAASLRRGRAGVVAVVVETRLLVAFRDPYAVSRLDGLASVLDDIPTGMLLLSQPLDDLDGPIARLATSAVDAAVFLGCGPEENPLVEPLRARDIPIVALGSPVGPDIVQVRIDDRVATRELARYVASLGHTRVAQVALPLGRGGTVGVAPTRELLDTPFPDCRGRLAAVADVFGDDTPASEAPSSDVEGGARAAALLLDVAPGHRPTAIFAHSDMMAVGVVRAAQDRGLSVPGDLTVTGFDGLDLAWWPGELTTVVQPGVGKGQAAGRAVRAFLDGKRPQDVALETHLRVGTTSGPPPDPDRN